MDGTKVAKMSKLHNYNLLQNRTFRLDKSKRLLKQKDDL